MGHTNSTANYNLPQFVGSDKPTWLGDVNGAMSAIDAAIATAASAATDAASVATNAATVAAGAVTTANAASETATAASTAASTATTTANNAADTANNAQSTAVLAKGTADGADAKADAATSAIGDLTELDTTDKSSVVAAINEVVAELPSGGGSVSVTADGVKTNADMFSELAALLDFSKITEKSVLRTANTVYSVMNINVSANTVLFTAYAITNSTAGFIQIGVSTTPANCYQHNVEIGSGTPPTWTYRDGSSNVVTAGQILSITY